MGRMVFTADLRKYLALECARANIYQGGGKNGVGRVGKSLMCCCAVAKVIGWRLT